MMLLARSQAESYSGFIKIGMAPDKINPEITERWIFLGMIIFSLGLQTAKILAIIPAVEPLVRNQVLLAPKSSEASCWDC